MLAAAGRPVGVAIALGLAFAGRGGFAQVGERAAATAPAVVVALELVVEDAKGSPVTDLRLEEVEVVQDATRQKVRTFQAGSRPGHYELSYVPLSGRAGGVTVRVARRGVVARGPDGPVLRPRVITTLSPLEAELTAVLEARAGAGDLTCDVAVYRFEPVAKGVRHAVAVEIPLSELRFAPGPPAARGRLQILARIRAQADPEVQQHVTLDQAVEVTTAAVVQRLVWTGAVVLGPGRHTIDVVVRDPAAERVTTRTLSVDVPPPTDRLRMSSVILLRPREFFFLRDQAEGDDPFVHQGVPLMPALQVTLAAGAPTHVRFHVVLYPAAGTPEPVTLRAELLRDGAMVGKGPIALPKAEPDGEIPYVGLLPTASFPAGSYVLRLVAQQGGAAAAEEAPFVLSPEGPAPLRAVP
jgi:hypothetical protein